MLVLSRLKNEAVVITIPGGQQIRVTLVDVRTGNGGKARLGFEAPRDVIIHRAEVQDRVDTEALNNQ